jgi:hypothetical protein
MNGERDAGPLQRLFIQRTTVADLLKCGACGGSNDMNRHGNGSNLGEVPHTAAATYPRNDRILTEHSSKAAGAAIPSSLDLNSISSSSSPRSCSMLQMARAGTKAR